MTATLCDGLDPAEIISKLGGGALGGKLGL